MTDEQRMAAFVKAVRELEDVLPRWARVAWRLWCTANRKRWERETLAKQLAWLVIARGVIGIEWGMIRQGIDPAEECRKRAERWEMN